MECQEQMREVMGVTKKLKMYLPDPAALRAFDAELLKKFGNKKIIRRSKWIQFLQNWEQLTLGC